MNDGLRLTGISYKSIPYIWELIVDFLTDALEFADKKYTLENVKEALINRDMQLWVVMDNDDVIHSLIITQIINYPNKKIMLIMFLAGIKFDDWSHFLPHFILFAKDHDCDAIEGYGRPGWEKKAKHLGFTKVHTIYSLPIKEQN